MNTQALHPHMPMKVEGKIPIPSPAASNFAILPHRHRPHPAISNAPTCCSWPPLSSPLRQAPALSIVRPPLSLCHFLPNHFGLCPPPPSYRHVVPRSIAFHCLFFHHPLVLRCLPLPSCHYVTCPLSLHCPPPACFIIWLLFIGIDEDDIWPSSLASLMLTLSSLIPFWRWSKGWWQWGGGRRRPRRCLHAAGADAAAADDNNDNHRV